MSGKCKKYLVICLLVVLPLSGLWQTGLAAWIHTKAIIAQYLLESAWTETLQGEKEVKPWPWADTWPVCRLTVPRLGISRIVLAGASGEALAFGPGLLLQTNHTDPYRHTVLVGHRDTHFRFLQDIRKNDVIRLQTQQHDTRWYRVTDLVIINETETGFLAERNDDTLTLITCYPFDAINPGGPLRYLAIATRITPTSA